MAGLDLGVVSATARLQTSQLQGDVQTATSLVQQFGSELEKLGNIAFGVAIGQQLDGILRKIEELPRGLIQANASFESFSAGVAAMFDVAAKQPLATAEQARQFADASLTQQNQKITQAQERARDLEENHTAALQRLAREQQEGQTGYDKALRDAAQQRTDFQQDQSRADQRATQDRVLHERDAQSELTRQLADYNQRWADGARERETTFTHTLDTMAQRHGETLSHLGEELQKTTSDYQRQLGDLQALQQATLEKFRDEAAQTVADAAQRVQDIHTRLTDQEASLQLRAQRTQIEYSFQVQDIQTRIATATNPREAQTAQRDLGRAQVLFALRQREEQLQTAQAVQTAQREEQQAQREEAKRLAALQRQEQQEREAGARRQRDLDGQYAQRSQALQGSIARENAQYAEQNTYVQQQYAQREQSARASYVREVAHAEEAYQRRVTADARAWTRQDDDRQVHLQREVRDYEQLLADLADRFRERQTRLQEEADTIARNFEHTQRKALESVAEAQQKAGDERTKIEQNVLNQGRQTAGMFSAEWIKATNAVAEANGRRAVFRAPEGIDEFSKTVDKSRQVFEALLDIERQVPVPLKDLQTAFLQLQGAGLDPFRNDLIRTVAELSRLPQVRGGITEVARAFQELAAGAPGQAEKVFRAIGLPLTQLPGIVVNAQNHIEGFRDEAGKLNTDTEALTDRVAKYIGERGDAIADHLKGTYAVLSSTLETLLYKFDLIAGDKLFGRVKDALSAFIDWMDTHAPQVQAVADTIGTALGAGLGKGLDVLRTLGDPVVLANLGNMTGAAGELGGALLGLAGGFKDVATQAGDTAAAKALGLFNDVMGDLAEHRIQAAREKLAALGIDLDHITGLKWDARGNFQTPIEEASGPIHDAIYDRMYSPTQQVADALKDITTLIREFRQAVDESAPAIVEAFGTVRDVLQAIDDFLNKILKLQHDLGTFFHPNGPVGKSQDPLGALIAGQGPIADAAAVARGRPVEDSLPGADYWKQVEAANRAGAREAFGAATEEVQNATDAWENDLLDFHGHSFLGEWLGKLQADFPAALGRIAEQSGQQFGTLTTHVERTLQQTGATLDQFGARASGASGAPGSGAIDVNSVPFGGMPNPNGPGRLYRSDDPARPDRQAPSGGYAGPANPGNTNSGGAGGPGALGVSGRFAAERERDRNRERGALQAAATETLAGLAGSNAGRGISGLGELQVPGGRYSGSPGTPGGPDSIAGGVYGYARPQLNSGRGDDTPPPPDVPPGYHLESYNGQLRPFPDAPTGGRPFDVKGGVSPWAGGGTSGLGGMDAGGLTSMGGLGVPIPPSPLGAAGGVGGVVSVGGGGSLPAPGGGLSQSGGGYDPQAAKAAAALLLAGTGYGGSGQQAFGIQGTAGLTYDQLYNRNPGDRRAVGATGAYNGVEAAQANQNPNAYVPPAAYNPAGSQYRAGVNVGGSLIIQQSDTGLMRDVVSTMRQAVETDS